MAENIVKSIKSERAIKQPKHPLEELPEVKQTNRQPKNLIQPKTEKSRTRAGNLPGGINIKGKAKLIENGRKIK